MSEEKQLQLLVANGMLIKCSIIVNGDTVQVGLKKAEYAEKSN